MPEGYGDGPSSDGLSKTLTDLLGLGKVGETLADAVLRGVSGLAAPMQTRRIGRAEIDVAAERAIRMAEAETIAASIRNGELSLRDRAGQKVLARALRRQRNTETVLAQTVPLLDKDADDPGQPPEDDWIEAFFRYAENVSNTDIQRIWARILATQVSGGRRNVSLATLDSLRLLEPHQAQAFAALAQAWAAFGSVLDISVGNPPDPNFTIYTEDHLALQGLGLVDIVHRSQHYIQGSGWALLMREKSAPPDLQDAAYKAYEFSHIRPSWRGIELCDALFPGLTDWTASAPSPDTDIGAWSDVARRAVAIQSWAALFDSPHCTICLARHARPAPLDDGAMTRTPAVQTHYFVNGQGWHRFPDVEDRIIALYPPEIHAVLQMTGSSPI